MQGTSEHLATWSEEYLPKMKALSPNTVRLYLRTCQAILADFGRLDDLTTEEIEGWLYRKGGAAGTMSNRISGLKSFFRYLVRIKVRIDNPMEPIEAPKKAKSIPKPVQNVPEILAKLDRLDEAANARLANDQKHLRPLGQSRAMAEVLLYTGLRIHEAVALDETVPVGDTLFVVGKGNKPARIPLVKEARDALDFLGGKWPIGARATQRRFEKAGFYPHQCRHWRGTSMAEAGADLGDIQAMMRHSSPATTLGYAQWNIDRVRSAVEKASVA